jgi:hypothetical protein
VLVVVSQLSAFVCRQLSYILLVGIRWDFQGTDVTKHQFQAKGVAKHHLGQRQLSHMMFLAVAHNVGQQISHVRFVGSCLT